MTLERAGLGGIAANHKYVVFGDRDLDDFHDVFRCLDADTGKQLWHVDRLAVAALDYGNSPRATPLIVDDRVIFLGAHGHLLCLNLVDGRVVWDLNLREESSPQGDLPWGFCGSPFMVNGKLIVNPGDPNASIVAINGKSGSIVWKTPGGPPSYGSLRLLTLGGRTQIVGHDKTTLGGWDPDTGQRIWTVTPQVPGDFNVPTPEIHNGRLLITTENNGTRMFEFDDNGIIIQKPVAVNSKLRPDMSTGVVVNDRFYCVNKFLYCLDLKNNLKELWRIRHSALTDYGSIIASNKRVLVVGKGSLLLLKSDGTKHVISTVSLFADNMPVYSHPAIVGNRLYIRGESKLLAISL